MPATTVLIAISIASVAFLTYVFIALSKEKHSGKCRFVQVIGHPEEQESDVQTQSCGVVQVDEFKRKQRDVSSDRRWVVSGWLRAGR